MNTTENQNPEKTVALLMDEVKHLYHRYGATTKDFIGRSRLTGIAARFRKEFAERPKLEEELRNAPESRNHFIMQTLLEMISEQTRLVETPAGTVVAYPKHDGSDSPEDYPGIFIDLRRKGKDDVMLACVEWLPGDNELQCCVYSDGLDDCPVPDPIHYVNLDEECDD